MPHQTSVLPEDMISPVRDFPKVRACLFDMDGLLIDSEDIYTFCNNVILQQFGRPCLPWTIKAQLQGRPAPESAEIFHAWAQLPISREEYLLKQAALQRINFPTTQPLPGVAGLLANLTASGTHIALATSSHAVNFKLKTAHLQPLFSHFAERNRVLGDDIRIPKGKGKPAPDIYLLALKTINDELTAQGQKEITPEECLVFEDSVPGVEAGRRAGMRVVWCPHPELLKIYRGREHEVLAGITGMLRLPDEVEQALDESGAKGRVVGRPGKIGDGWAELLITLKGFPYEKYGIETNRGRLQYLENLLRPCILREAMSTSTPNSSNPSRIATPNPGQSRFTAQAATAEDLLQSQTVGLVRLDDFRKRRADALEQKELGRFTNARSDPAAATPANVSDGGSTPKELPKKKKRKTVAKGKLSFGVENEEEEEEDTASTPRSAAATPKESTPTETLSRTASPATVTQRHDGGEKKRLGPNSKLAVAPKAMTKSALLREAQAREQLRKEFLSMQEAVKNTEFIIPFVFYDGTNIPGGSCKVKKGDHTWVFLDRSRKAGADLGVGGSEKANSRREWARVGVDDLMLVRGEVIIPHHYEFYYFIVNRTLGPSSIPLFNYSASVIPSSRSQSSSPEPPEAYNPLEAGPRPSKRANNSIPSPQDLLRLEGATDDPNFTKVVDRRWYERNKHIFPASVWEEFDPGKDYSKGRRRDMEGNAFFFG